MRFVKSNGGGPNPARGLRKIIMEATKFETHFDICPVLHPDRKLIGTIFWSRADDAWTLWERDVQPVKLAFISLNPRCGSLCLVPPPRLADPVSSTGRKSVGSRLMSPRCFVQELLEEVLGRRTER